MHVLEVCRVFVTRELIQHHGGVAIFYRYAPHFQVEALQPHGTNILRFQVVSGGRHWFISGCYLPPDNAVTTKRVIEVIGQHTRKTALLLDGDFKTELAAPEGSSCVEDIVAAISTARMEDISARFLLCRKSWVQDGRMWNVRLQGREVRSWTDQLLETDSRLFRKASVGGPCHNSDHFMALGCIHGAAQRENSSYLGRRQRSPHTPSETAKPGRLVVCHPAKGNTQPPPPGNAVRTSVSLQRRGGLFTCKCWCDGDPRGTRAASGIRVRRCKKVYSWIRSGVWIRQGQR